MTVKPLACIALFCALVAQIAQAAPTLSVTPLGINGSNNREWAVDIAPNPVPGSMAVELAFAVDETDLLNIDVNTLAWDFELPGSNPFTGTVTEGLWLDLIGDRTFGAFGSVVFTTPDPVRLFTIESLGGSDATIRYGTAASGNANKGNIIANAQGTFRYSGSVSVPEPASMILFAAAIVGCGIGLFRRR